MTSFDDADSVQVAAVAQRYEAELIALRLRESGIDAHVVNQSFDLMPIPENEDFDTVRVMVPADESEKARRILSQPLVALPEDAELATSSDEKKD
jgi:hypothetical protein